MIPAGLYTYCSYVLANRSRALVITAGESYAPPLSGILLFLLDLAVLSHRLFDAPISTLDTIIPFPQIVPNRHDSPLFRSYLISPSLLILVVSVSPAYPDRSLINKTSSTQFLITNHTRAPGTSDPRWTS